MLRQRRAIFSEYAYFNTPMPKYVEVISRIVFYDLYFIVFYLVHLLVDVWMFGNARY